MAVKTLSTEIKTPTRNPDAAPVADSLDCIFTAPTVAADGIDFVAQGNEIILVLNSDAATPYTCTLVSEGDALGRTRDMTNYSLGAGEALCLQLPLTGWANASTSKIKITMNNVAVKVLVLRPTGLVNS